MVLKKDGFIEGQILKVLINLDRRKARSRLSAPQLFKS
jgi:hypothetical protein